MEFLLRSNDDHWGVEGLFRAKSYVEQLELELVLLLKSCILVPRPQKK